jgi:hypothetical protein
MTVENIPAIMRSLSEVSRETEKKKKRVKYTRWKTMKTRTGGDTEPHMVLECVDQSVNSCDFQIVRVRKLGSNARLAPESFHLLL